jgi:hypothetical protein
VYRKSLLDVDEHVSLMVWPARAVPPPHRSRSRCSVGWRHGFHHATTFHRDRPAGST